MTEERSPDSQDESLADVPPTPAEPEVVTRAGNLALGAVTLTVAGAGAFLLIAGSMSTCMGATRSTRLEWEKRQQEIERAEREFEIQAEADASSDGRNVSSAESGKN